MNTDTVLNCAVQHSLLNEELQGQIQSMLSALRSVDWTSPGRDSFMNDFENLCSKIINLSSEGDDLTRRLQNEVNQWENLLYGVGSVQGVSISNLGFNEWASGVVAQGNTIYDAFGEYIMPVSSLLFLGALMKTGSAYSDQVLLYGPEQTKLFGFTVNGYRETIFGLNSNIRHSSGINIVNKMAKDNVKFGVLNTLTTGAKLGTEWVKDYSIYEVQGLEYVASAFSVDAGISALSIAAETKGMIIGGTIGSAICPGVGTVAGGVIGGMVGNWAVDYTTHTPLNQVTSDVIKVGISSVPGIGYVANTFYGDGIASYVNQTLNVTDQTFKEIAVDGIVNGAQLPAQGLIWTQNKIQHSDIFINISNKLQEI